MSNCKPGKKYPYKMRRKMCYTSPTSGRQREGFPTIHCDRERNEEFTVNRAVGGGVKRTYNWKKYYSSV